MIRINFNKDWRLFKGNTNSMMTMMSGGGPEPEPVDLPHDAMVHEERTKDTKNAGQTGFYPGGVYTYTKTLAVPVKWQEKRISLEFEGVYHTAMVYVNGCMAGKNLHGYSNFYIPLEPYLHYGEDNEIKVVADNASELNTRWYSGSGIYRDVKLLVGNRIYIPADGVHITTPSVSEESALVEVETRLVSQTRSKEKVTVNLTVMREGKVVGSDKVKVTMFPENKETIRQSICLTCPDLWEPDSPALYDCMVTVEGDGDILDEVKEHFGIRSLSLDSLHGLRINGKEVKLRGACIHHDNGIIGAATFARAEERRCRQLKEAGFNSIRMSHHPMSKAMLNACDRIGLIVMDELSDMWTFHKNQNDFALHFTDCWEQEVERMVAKNYNHPSVVMYSTGNEIPEMGTDAGAGLNRKICNKIYSLDHTRYTINAMNGLLAAGSRLGEIAKSVMEAQMAGQQIELQTEPQAEPQTEPQTEQQMEPQTEQTAAPEQMGNQEGSNALNSIMSLIFGKDSDAFAANPLMTEVLEEGSLTTDMIGFNYLTGRHVLEKELHPNKTVVGTETFPSDIVRLWGIVKRNPHVLGDYTWTGYDYLGEAGIGIFYYNGNQNFNAVFPDRVAYIGDINLIGYRRPISYLREIVFGLRKDPYVAVERLNRYGMEHSQTAWMFKDNIASWTWPGYEGKPAKVDIYADAGEVELFLNGRSLGRKPAGEEHDFTASYEITYEPGELTGVSYENGAETGRFSLVTAKEQVRLQAEADRTAIKGDGEDLAFVTVRLVDENGVENLSACKEVTVSVEGAGNLQGFGSADPQAANSYDDSTWNTFDGYIMAVIRPANHPGQIKVRFSAEGCEDSIVLIDVVE